MDAVRFKSPDGSEIWLIAYWGKWSAFLKNQTLDLRKQEKYHGHCLPTLMARTKDIVGNKVMDGYRIQQQFSALPEWNILPFGQSPKEYID